MEIIIAKSAGFCFGVKRALEMVESALADQNQPIYSLGPLIHNPQVVAELHQKGLQVVETIEQIPAGRVVIRSHGVGPHVYEIAAQRVLEVIDATCPFVKNVQQLAVLLREQGYLVVIFGEREHAEVRGVLESVAGEAIVIDEVHELQLEKLSGKIGLISQTTQDIESYCQLIDVIIPYAKELRVFNTICLATSQRQQEAADLSRQVELMIVVGGRNSANTARLVEICKNVGVTAYQVESAEELESRWFININRVGVTAGASTPDQYIQAVIQKISFLGGNVSD